VKHKRVINLGNFEAVAKVKMEKGKNVAIEVSVLFEGGSDEDRKHKH